MLATATPINPTTGNEYSGGNVDRLVDAMDSNPRFVSGSFATFRQWLSVGRCVQKGEKAAARLVAYGSGQVEVQESGEAKSKGRFLKPFSVFALEQTAPITDGPAPQDDQESAQEAIPATNGTEAKEDKPEAGKVYSLATLAKGGEWSKAEVKPEPVRLLNLETIREKAARLERLAAGCHADRLTNTAKRLGQAMHKRMEGDRMAKAAAMLSALADAVEANPAHALASLATREAIDTATEAAIYEVRMVSNGYHSYNVETDKPRHDSEMYRAFRALMNPAAVAASAAKSEQVQAEAELRQCDFPGFFPTPPSVIAVMLEQAGDLTGKTVLEPSAGKGDLVNAALEAGAASVTAYEIVPKLADYMARFVSPRGSQAVTSQNADFLDRLPTSHASLVDVVLMNPPFERDAAPRHVLHALGWLKDGGALVAVMPANWAEKSAADMLLRTIDDRGWQQMDMEIEGAAFNGADAFRQTAVRTSLLIIRK
jgi:16S rRNA G966 N2-methylase RsmD